MVIKIRSLTGNTEYSANRRETDYGIGRGESVKTRGCLRSDGQTVNRLFRCQGVRKARYEMSLWRSQSQKAMLNVRWFGSS